MTVYVDNYRRPATIGRIRARWSHLTATSPAELHAFADQLGLRREWFQPCCKTRCGDVVDGMCVHYHYDVTDTKRAAALEAGAQPVDIREMGAIASARRPAFRDAITAAGEKP